MSQQHLSHKAIIERLRTGKRWDFPGGVHPVEYKELSNQTEIARIPLPEKLYIPLKQHIGVEGQLQVKPGQHVLKGEALTSSAHPFAVPIHASTSGTVKDILEHVSAHPSGLTELTVVLEPDGNDQWLPLSPLLDYQRIEKAKLVETICDAGISGMGGAGFPSHIKAQPGKKVEFLVINGVECEPYITSDDRLMREHAWQIRQGIDVLKHLLSPEHVIVAVEDNKPEALEALQVACRDSSDYLVCSVETKYPAGGEKQLVQVLTGREVPGQGLPIDVGVIMYNVGTCYAIADAVFSGKPLIERVVTMTGKALQKPQNVWAPLGTPVQHLLDVSDYQVDRQSQPRAIMGGPMMGFTVTDPLVPVVKITNCLLIPEDNEILEEGREQPCIRCGACADACPASLLPQQLYWHSKANELDKAQDYNLFDCIECGACAYVCPSEIPLVHYYRKSKADIRNQKDEKNKAEKARARFEARKERLLAEQQAREEKHRKAAEARKQAMQNKQQDKQAGVAEAVKRAKARKQEGEEQPAPPSSSKNAAVAAAIARAKAKKVREADQTAQTETNESAQTKESVAEAAKPSASEQKQQKIAAAVARAKARKQAQAEEVEQKDSTSNTTTRKPESKLVTDNSAAQATDGKQQASEEQIQKQASDKQQRIAAAVARAKAKKAQQQKLKSEQAGTDKQDTPATSEDENNP